MKKRKTNHFKEPTQRQQRVAEEIRHVISMILQRGEIWSEQLQNIPITISEVRISIDLKNAFVFIMPLCGENIEDTLFALKENSVQIRSLLAKNIHLKTVPRLFFHVDTIFENVDKIERLLNQPHVIQDLQKQSA